MAWCAKVFSVFVYVCFCSTVLQQANTSPSMGQQQLFQRGGTRVRCKEGVWGLGGGGPPPPLLDQGPDPPHNNKQFACWTFHSPPAAGRHVTFRGGAGGAAHSHAADRPARVCPHTFHMACNSGTPVSDVIAFQSGGFSWFAFFQKAGSFPHTASECGKCKCIRTTELGPNPVIC